MARSELTVRMVSNEDWFQMERLSDLNGFTMEDGSAFDWTDVEPFWVVALFGEGIIGAVQMCPAKPVGDIERLLIDPGLEPMDRARVTRRLIDMASEALRAYGVQVASGVVSDEEPGFKNVALRRGWSEVDHGSVMRKRLVA